MGDSGENMTGFYFCIIPTVPGFCFEVKIAGITAAHGKTQKTAGANSRVLSTVCPRRVELIARILWTKSQKSPESELLLVTRSNDNHSPGPVMREVSP